MLNKKRRRKAVNFNPNRDYIESAVDDFLKNGGKIKKVQAGPENFVDFISGQKDREEYDFLMGES